MKVVRVALLLACVAFTQSLLHGDELKNNFQANLTPSALDALAQDIGAMVGGSSFHQGKPLGFPLGFDVGVHASVVEIQDEDVILRDDESYWGAGFGQVEVGLPARLGVIGRVGSLGDGTIYGGGLRYGLLDSSLPGIPKISLLALYDKMDHDFFDMTHTSINAVLSFDLPVIRPYLGGGWDNTKLDLTDAAFSSVPASVDRSLEGSSDGYRAEAGVNLSLIPFTYLSLGAGLANGGALYHVGLGLFF